VSLLRSLTHADCSTVLLDPDEVALRRIEPPLIVPQHRWKVSSIGIGIKCITCRSATVRDRRDALMIMRHAIHSVVYAALNRSQTRLQQIKQIRANES